MQKLSRVKRVKRMNWGKNSAMIERPAIAIKVAQFIADWSEVESVLGLLLAFLLHAHETAALAIYSSIENRSSQFRLIESAARSTLEEEHADVLDVIIRLDIRPIMKYRDKLAHWVWGYTDEIDNCLLIAEPSANLKNLADATKRPQRDGGFVSMPMDLDFIYVVREKDLDSAIQRLDEGRSRLVMALSTVKPDILGPERAQRLRELSSLPHVQKALGRLHEERQKSRETDV